ncbi:MAG: galactitol-1-phosphate 5-dehydrogenase [Candidatus Gastranaerophilales bacterium]|nr:galactitol-1-phosphate 5-dehydrogenase [Candidatus Gastranaerophilales bacterium]
MKAWVLHDIDDLRMESVGEPVLKEGEVLVRVKAAGICGSDIPRIYRTGTYSYPLIPGHEFSGIVDSVGEKADKSWAGARVGIFPLIPCGECAPCRKKQYEMCRHYSYLGSRQDGGFAEYAAVPERNLLRLPDNVSYEEAAMLEPMAVAVHAMRRAMPKGKDTVAVSGLGTIGLLLLMFLLETREKGVQTPGKILAIGNKEFQRQTVLKLGLPGDCYLDCRQQDPDKWIQEQTGGAGADVFFECVGKNETFAQAVDNAAPGGTVMLVGNPASDMSLERSIYWKILRNQLTLLGTWNSSFTGDLEDDWHYVLQKLAQRKIAPKSLITHRFPLEGLEQGFRIMRDKTEDYVKIMGCAR